MGAAQQRLSVLAADQEGSAWPSRFVRDVAGCSGGNIHDAGRRSPRYHKVDPQAPDSPETYPDDPLFQARTVWMGPDAIMLDRTLWWPARTVLGAIWGLERPNDGLRYVLDEVRDTRRHRDMTVNLDQWLWTDIRMVSRAGRPEGCDHAIGPEDSAQLDGGPAVNPWHPELPA